MYVYIYKKKVYEYKYSSINLVWFIFLLNCTYLWGARWPHGQSARRAIAEAKQTNGLTKGLCEPQRPVIGWVTKVRPIWSPLQNTFAPGTTTAIGSSYRHFRWAILRAMPATLVRLRISPFLIDHVGIRHSSLHCPLYLFICINRVFLNTREN
jgi:hypothetical protein